MAVAPSHMVPATELSRSNETGMSLLLVALLTLVAAEQVFALPLSMGPGLSMENALIYVVLSALIFKMAVQRSTRFELRALHICFFALIGYAALTLIVAALVIQYPGYRTIKYVISLKARLVDQLVFFAVFFYALHHSRSAFNVMKALLLLTVLMNVIALLDGFGYIEAAGLVEREDGRAQGIMGESNQSAAFIATFLPALVAMTLVSRGVARMFWIGGLLVCVAAMFMSASRGGLVAVLVASLWGLACFHKYVSTRSILAVTGVALSVVAIALPLVMAEYGALLVNRFVGDTSSVDIVDVSSGRLDIWAGLLSTMAGAPITFLSGYGWEVYDSMPFRLAPHNHYLALWFNLGLVGLVCGTALLVIVAHTAIKSVSLLANPYRSALMAFAIGTVAIATATFFVDLYKPWTYFWAYAGLAMRIAVNARYQQPTSLVETNTAAAPLPKHDPFGWVANAR